MIFFFFNFKDEDQIEDQTVSKTPMSPMSVPTSTSPQTCLKTLQSLNSSNYILL